MSNAEDYLPRAYIQFWEQNPAVGDAFRKLAEHEHAAGSLDERSRRLVKLGIAIGAASPGAVRSQTRQALRAGLAGDEIRHAVLLALSSVGLPQTVAASGWVEEVLNA